MLADPGLLLYCRLLAVFPLPFDEAGGVNPPGGRADGANMVWPSSLTRRRLFIPQLRRFDMIQQN